MMRWVILIAILVNVVLFYWFGGQQAQRIAAQKNRDVFVGSGVDTIELIAEIPEDRLVYIEDSPLLPEQIPEEAVEVSDPVAAPGVCMVIGPVLFEAVAEQIAGELKAAGVAVSMWVEVNTVIGGYRLYLPPQHSRAAARRLQEELDSRQIESFIYTEGEMTDGLSLGFFNSLGRARQRRATIVAEGYQPLLKVEEKIIRHHWLEVPVQFESKLYENFASEIALKDENSKMLKNSCRVVATWK